MIDLILLICVIIIGSLTTAFAGLVIAAVHDKERDNKDE